MTERLRCVRGVDRNKRWGDTEWSRICSACHYARINVRHNTTPESQIPEGPDYYRDMTDLHTFVPSDRFTTSRSGSKGA